MNIQLELDKVLDRKILELQEYLTDFFETVQFSLVGDVVNVGVYDSKNIEDYKYQFVLQKEKNNKKTNIGFVGRTYTTLLNKQIRDLLENNFLINKKHKIYSENNIFFEVENIKTVMENNSGFDSFITLIDIFEQFTKSSTNCKISFFSKNNIRTKNNIESKMVMTFKGKTIEIFTNKYIINNERYWKMIVYKVFYQKLDIFDKNDFLISSIDEIKEQLELISY